MRICLFVLFSTISFLALSQSVRTPFGKNRVQHHNDFRAKWMYETENFITYWYGKSKEVAKTTIQMAELDHDEIQNIMEHRFNDKIEIIVYLDLTDIKQSNAGLEETFINDPKETKIDGNKMFVYFDGNHKNLRLQIRRGIAAIYLNSILIGVNLQEVVQNAVLFNLPEWYKKGLIEYVGSYWNVDADDELRELVTQKEGKYFQFEKLKEDYPKIAGHSFWYFLDQNYGKSSISNILYLTKINRDLESSFVYVLSQEYPEVTREWESFYRNKYNLEQDKFVANDELEIDVKNKPEQPISRMRLSPDGTQLMYVYNEIGKYRVILRNLSDNSEKVLFKYGFKNKFQETDYNYPHFEWNPNGVQVSILWEDKDDLYMRKIYLADDTYEEQEIPEKIQRVYSLSYADNVDYILSASDDGYSDLFSYKWKTRQFKKITNDYHDDLDAVSAVYDGKKGILFSSTRESNLIEKVEKLSTMLPLDNYDLFFLPEGSNQATRVTFTPEVNERYPFPIGTEQLSFISDQSGIRNRYIKSFKSEDQGYATSNLDRNIIRHHSTSDSGLSVYTLYKGGGYAAYMEYVDTASEVGIWLTDHKRESRDQTVRPLVLEQSIADEEVKEEYLFETDFDDPPELEEINGIQDKTSFFTVNPSDSDFSKDYNNVEAFNTARAVASRLRFKLVDVSSGFDNSVLFEGLESNIGDSQELLNQPVGIRFKAVVKDLFEDYRIELGARYPTSLNGSEYYLTIEDNKKWLDKKYALYRRSRSVNEVLGVFPTSSDKRVFLQGLAQIKMPIDIYRSLRLTGTLRSDRIYPRAINLADIEREIEEEKRIGLKVEYVFDSTNEKDINIIHGTRYKVYVEALNRFDLQIQDGFEFDASNGFTTVIGADFRNYTPLGRWASLAFRATGATSLGSNKMLYHLGGIEGGLFSSFNNDIPIPTDDQFAFRALAPHLRGFNHNIRNGSSYLLSNTELRLPVVRQIFGRVKNNFLRNLMFTGFFDIGSAWHGLSPYSDENPLNIVTVENTSVVVTANFFRDPFVYGYGVGMRSTFLGYYLKLDYGWGVETRTILSPKLYFSLGTDF